MQKQSLKLSLLLLWQALLVFLAPGSNAIKVGESIPDNVDLHYGFPPEKINLKERMAGKNIILVGLPGAFTPTCSSRQVPGYLANAEAIKALGVDEVLVYCVNDGAGKCSTFVTTF